MTKARMNITKAVAMASSSMEYWYGYSGSTTPFTEMAKNKHQWARQAWSQSKDALSGGNNGIFYFPWHLPDSVPGSYWPDGSNDEYDGDTASIIYGNKIYGVKLSKFFTPGVFTLTNLFTTESGGRAPSLFKIEWYEDDEFNPVYLGDYNYKLVTGPITGRGGEQNVAGTGYDASYGIYTFEVNTKNLKEIFPKGFGDIGNANGGKALFSKVFPHIPLWPWAETYFTGISEVAGRLYEFYHKSTVD